MKLKIILLNDEGRGWIDHDGNFEWKNYEEEYTVAGIENFGPDDFTTDDARIIASDYRECTIGETVIIKTGDDRTLATVRFWRFSPSACSVEVYHPDETKTADYTD